ncbi:MAG: hypothetical protein QW478_05235 [Candidatus Micrarchaeaceae archaeon]
MVKTEDITELKTAIDELKDTFNSYKTEQEFLTKKIEAFTNSLIQLEVDIQKLTSFGDDYEQSNEDRNKEIIKQLQEAKQYLINEKNEIAKETVNSLGLEGISAAITANTQLLQSATKTLEEYLKGLTTITDTLSVQTKSLASSVDNIKRINESLGTSIDYNRETENIINFMKANSKREITVDELIFRFNPSIVREVLKKGEALKYWKFRF